MKVESWLWRLVLFVPVALLLAKADNGSNNKVNNCHSILMNILTDENKVETGFQKSYHSGLYMRFRSFVCCTPLNSRRIRMEAVGNTISCRSVCGLCVISSHFQAI